MSELVTYKHIPYRADGKQFIVYLDGEEKRYDTEAKCKASITRYKKKFENQAPKKEEIVVKRFKMGIYKLRAEYSGGMDTYQKMILARSIEQALLVANAPQVTDGDRVHYPTPDPHRLGQLDESDNSKEAIWVGLSSFTVACAKGGQSGLLGGGEYHAGEPHNPLNCPSEEHMYQSNIDWEMLFEWKR